MIDFPKICRICRENDPKKLTDCLKCEGVSYCSYNHKDLDKTVHDKICDSLRVIYRFRIDHTSSKLVIDSSIIPKTFPINLLEMINILTKQNIKEIPTTQEEYNRLSEASHFSCVATLLYGLDILDLRNNSMKNLTIHIVGSAELEVADFNENITLIFVSFLPKVEILNLIFVGPELKANFHHSYQQRHLKFNLLFKKGLYHEIIPCLQGTPDAIISFNCGFSEFDKLKNNSWRKSIDSIMNFINVPLIFTSYTKKESNFDVGAIEKRCETNDVDSEIFFAEFGNTNPFRDCRPLRNWDNRDEEIYFVNGVIQIIRFMPRSN